MGINSSCLPCQGTPENQSNEETKLNLQVLPNTTIQQVQESANDFTPHFNSKRSVQDYVDKTNQQQRDLIIKNSEIMIGITDNNAEEDNNLVFILEKNNHRPELKDQQLIKNYAFSQKHVSAFSTPQRSKDKIEIFQPQENNSPDQVILNQTANFEGDRKLTHRQRQQRQIEEIKIEDENSVLGRRIGFTSDNMGGLPQTDNFYARIQRAMFPQGSEFTGMSQIGYNLDSLGNIGFIPRSPQGSLDLGKEKDKTQNLLQNFILEEVLAIGPSSITWKLRSRQTMDYYVLKMVKKVKLEGHHKQFIKKIQKQLLGKAFQSSAKILQIYNDKLYIYLLMEYIDGKPLYQSYLENEGFTYSQLSCIILHLLQSLQILHQYQLLHTDIKPKNILISNQRISSSMMLWSSQMKSSVPNIKKEQAFSLKLINFFNLIHVEPDILYKKSYYHPQYLSLELLNQKEIQENDCQNLQKDDSKQVVFLDKNEEGQENEDMQSLQTGEIWQIGVILYIMVTGEYPINGESDKEVIYNILELSETWRPELDESKINPKLFSFLIKLLDPNYFARTDKTVFINDDFVQQELSQEEKDHITNLIKGNYSKIYKLYSEESFIESAVTYICGGKWFAENFKTKIINHLQKIDKHRMIMYPIQIVRKAFTNYLGEEYLSQLHFNPILEQYLKKKGICEYSADMEIDIQFFLNCYQEWREMFFQQKLMKSFVQLFFIDNDNDSVKFQVVQEIANKEIANLKNQIECKKFHLDIDYLKTLLKRCFPFSEENWIKCTQQNQYKSIGFKGLIELINELYLNFENH